MAQVAVNYDQTAPEVERALRDEFNGNTVITLDEGYLGRVNVRIISPTFDGMSEPEKQDVVWRVLKEAMGDRVLEVGLVVQVEQQRRPAQLAAHPHHRPHAVRVAEGAPVVEPASARDQHQRRPL